MPQQPELLYPENSLAHAQGILHVPQQPELLYPENLVNDPFVPVGPMAPLQLAAFVATSPGDSASGEGPGPGPADLQPPLAL